MSDAGLRQYSSLDDAFARGGIPDANRAFIRQFVDRIGVSALFETSGYIKAVRRIAGPDLRIASGWTEGFVDEAEILDCLGDVDRWPSAERRSLWGVSHPENRIGHGGGGAAGPKDRDYGTCPRCGMTYFANGTCGC